MTDTNSTDQPRWVTEAKPVPATSDGPHYPASDVYRFGEFAYLVVEAGGYGDLTAVDPYTGRRFWSPVFDTPGADDLSPYDVLRRLIDAMEAHAFLDGGDDDGIESAADAPVD